MHVNWSSGHLEQAPSLDHLRHLQSGFQDFLPLQTAAVHAVPNLCPLCLPLSSQGPADWKWWGLGHMTSLASEGLEGQPSSKCAQVLYKGWVLLSTRKEPQAHIFDLN